MRRKKLQTGLEPYRTMNVPFRNVIAPVNPAAICLSAGRGFFDLTTTPEGGSETDVQQGMRDMRHRKEALPEIDSELQAHIGRHLKAAYEDILNQPVPDRFSQLLSELGKAEGAPGVGQEEGRNDGKVLRS